VISRRAFIAVTGAELLVAPAIGVAQQAGRVYRIGYLTTSNPPSPQSSPLLWGQFVPGLRDLGYVEGRDFVLEVRAAGGEPERLLALAAELVRLEVDIILTSGDGEVRAAKHATSVIPIVMVVSGDPVRAGYVASLARPGGNITGQSFLSPNLSAKLLEVLKEAVPKVSRVAILWNATNPVKVLDFKGAQHAAQTLGLTVHSIELKPPKDRGSAFAAIKRVRPDALLTLTDEVLNPTVMSTQVEDFAIKERLPSIFGDPRHIPTGGLISYSPNLKALWRHAATYVDKILKGAKPADLPVEQPTKFELVINLKTAKALGLTIPPSLLARADQVIHP
jgi:putative tryptophan/tyrosine transport system substrate-binding protein